MNNKRIVLSIRWVLLVFCLGCGDEDRGYVTGTVSLNGQPIGPGKITFEPIRLDAPFAGSQFGVDGKYSLYSPGNKSGALTGEYAVRIQDYDDETYGEEIAINGKPKNVKIPLKYLDPSKSQLKATIESGSQVIDFDLKP